METGGVHRVKTHLRFERGGVIDQGGEPAGPIDSLEQTGDLRLGTDVGLNGKRLTAFGFNRANYIFGVALPAQKIHANCVAAAGRKSGSGCPDAAAAARDQQNPGCLHGVTYIVAGEARELQPELRVGRTMGPRVIVLAILLGSYATAGAAEADALAISKNIQNRHFPHYTLLDPIFAGPAGDQIVSYTRCGDSALWTGFDLAAESFRYKVTQSADALAAAQRALAGIQSLIDVTGNNVLARCLIPVGSPYAEAIQNEEAANGIYHSGPENFWVGNTSRDEYSGVLFGLGVAYDLMDDPAMKATIAAQVTRMVQFLKDHGWSVFLPDGTTTTTFLDRPDQQLAFLQLARHVNPDQFSTAYDIARILLSPVTALPIGFDTLSNGSYFKFNLDSINLYTLIHLESSSFGSLYDSAYSVLRNHTAGQGNAFFNMIDAALHGPNAARDAETRLLLDQWLQRPRRDLHVDNTGKYATCGDPTQACQPIPVPDRPTTDFLWQRSPYQLANNGGSNIIEGAGIDYILPYWMARYYQVIAPDNLREGSAASYAPTLAPDSIATVTGLNLTSTSGLTVTVKDSAAAAWPATVFYSSMSQVNLLVPDGTAPGTASITIQVPGAPDTVLSAEIRAVAPGLFTADTSGRGAAAATVNGAPVFTCSASGCATVPISVSGASVVYLSLYGTGIRHRSSTANVTCTVGGVTVPVLYAGAQNVYPGLDQVNVQLSGSLRGLGTADLILTVDGQAANTVRIAIQ
jgi:uncharacterized protein (TIGR03437 family)